uniref:Uncharacterized protein n=1 Tax=Anopheles albimanus TaxID=7167 RepID=A0A182FEX9_ANOAL
MGGSGRPDRSSTTSYHYHRTASSYSDLEDITPERIITCISGASQPQPYNHQQHSNHNHHYHHQHQHAHQQQHYQQYHHLPQQHIQNLIGDGGSYVSGSSQITTIL